MSCFLQRSRHARKTGRAPTSHPRSFRPKVETLEDREVLSYVTPYFDPVSGFNQLQVWTPGVNGHLYNHWYDGSWNSTDFRRGPRRLRDVSAAARAKIRVPLRYNF